jgi:hypothetical protein
VELNVPQYSTSKILGSRIITHASIAPFSLNAQSSHKYEYRSTLPFPIHAPLDQNLGSRANACQALRNQHPHDAGRFQTSRLLESSPALTFVGHSVVCVNVGVADRPSRIRELPRLWRYRARLGYIIMHGWWWCTSRVPSRLDVEIRFGGMGRGL